MTDWRETEYGNRFREVPTPPPPPLPDLTGKVRVLRDVYYVLDGAKPLKGKKNTGEPVYEAQEVLGGTLIDEDATDIPDWFIKACLENGSMERL